ncbi:RidA family protein [Paraburkholderia sp. Ac-20340]|uniref:RidA family protein n=1 Tax=Paraburkholderia sp. Ac-20340 TaxID=2703888 RepID=UPI00197D9F45|nr:RidA family protein [Paraburkholderia sp. Ac-20340]MBN3853504.1 RidA family protein [Paraburkholderia sp. Ac-20340]
MPDTIETGLPNPGQPFSWATRAGGLMFTAHGPMDSSGAIAGEDIVAQTRLTLANLEQAVKAAGAQLSDVAQVLIYMANAADMPAIDAEYRRFFSAPWPNRTSVAVKGFAHPAMLIELVAYVGLPSAATPTR